MENNYYVKEYTTKVRELCDIIEAMFVEDKATLLSPVFRRMVIRDAHKLRKYHDVMAGYLEIASFIKLEEKMKEINNEN